MMLIKGFVAIVVGAFMYAAIYMAFELYTNPEIKEPAPCTCEGKPDCVTQTFKVNEVVTNQCMTWNDQSCCESVKELTK